MLHLDFFKYWVHLLQFHGILHVDKNERGPELERELERGAETQRVSLYMCEKVSRYFCVQSACVTM